MTRDDIIRMAREAGGTVYTNRHVDGSAVAFGPESLARFAALVAAAEREACAKVCEERMAYWQRDDNRRDEDEHCAAAIRARGEKE